MATPWITSLNQAATQFDIELSQDQLDRGIRKEFKTVHEYMELRFGLVDERFEEQSAHIDDR